MKLLRRSFLIVFRIEIDVGPQRDCQPPDRIFRWVTWDSFSHSDDAMDLVDAALAGTRYGRVFSAILRMAGAKKTPKRKVTDKKNDDTKKTKKSKPKAAPETPVAPSVVSLSKSLKTMESLILYTDSGDGAGPKEDEVPKKGEGPKEGASGAKAE